MEKVKVGIITHYYKSSNYGGNLQAYALTRFLNMSENVNAEQLCYVKNYSQSRKRIRDYFNVKKVVKYILRKFYYCFANLKNGRNIALRKNAILKFNEEYINHTDKAYNLSNIKEVADDFDVFIVGSDQVWNPIWLDGAFLLNFVPKDKIKIAYAAGVSSENLSVETQQIFKQELESFSAISVRESKGVELLQPLTEKEVKHTVDPTLLLSAEEWDSIRSPEKIKEKYVFCYFLGGVGKYKKEIIKFAKKNNLKIVNLPHLCGFQISDERFADYNLYEISPADFISLVKYSEYVFTDSFHATVFSHIYKRNFFVFNRKGFKAMNDRIYSLTDLFDTEDRFCDTKEKCTLEYIESLPPIDYEREFPKFEEMKEKSINFLKDNLNNCKI